MAFATGALALASAIFAVTAASYSDPQVDAGQLSVPRQVEPAPQPEARDAAVTVTREDEEEEHDAETR